MNCRLNTFCFTLILIVFSIVNFQNFCFAQETGDDVVIGKYQKIHSKVLDEDRLLSIHLPRDYENTEMNYPVMYLLYGQDINNYFAPAVINTENLGSTGEIPQMIVVGVANTNRYRDNLPVSPGPGREEGGADNFLKVFEEEIIPYIEKNYRTKDYRILVGPQAGCVFGLYALMTKPHIFNAYIINNPFQNPQVNEYLYKMAEESFPEAQFSNRFLYIKCEADESEPALNYLKRFSEMLGSAEPQGLSFHLETSEPSGNFILPLAFKKGLRTIFSGYKLPSDFQTKSVNDIIKYYKNLSEKYGFEIDVPELMLTFEGDKLLNQRKTEEAIELFKYHLSLYPKGLNSFWRLGNIYYGLGDFENAAYYYKGFLNIRDTDAAMVHQRLRAVEKMINESAVYVTQKEILKNGIQAGLKKFREIKSDPNSELYYNENEFNSLGYRLLGMDRMDDALEIFKLNVELYPKSGNTHDSLGEAYMNKGDKKLAVKHYKKSLELNPENNNASEMLKRLENK
ncbi:alpha/beta hydrolase-fold protein [candidate division KSB1 bacterium]